ncbi:MAG: pantothenate kinase [Staphylothermus sp.]|nr:pantothenate kinase [Staphylothermus sp.]
MKSINYTGNNDIVVRVPLHVSGLWFPSINNDPLHTGSLGAGVNLSIYLEARLEQKSSKPRIFLNDSDVLRNHVEFLCREYKLCNTVKAYSPIGLGTGFGVSAACLIAYSILSNIVQEKGTTLERATWPAHIAEVYYRTGLGDVISEFYGGIEIRTRPGPPGIGSIEHILLKKDYDLITIVLEGKEPTPTMLSRIKPEYYNENLKLLDKLLDNPSIENLFELAHSFTKKIFNYEEITRLINKVKNKTISFYRKKQAILILPEPEWVDDIIEDLKSLGLRILKTKISHKGVEIVYPPESST